MKKNGILNSHIAKVLADLGHTDTIVIASQNRSGIINRHTVLSGGHLPPSSGNGC